MSAACAGDDRVVAELSTAAFGVLSSDELNDFYLQDVCLNNSGQPMATDPYACGAGVSQRNMQLDEAVLFLRHDQPVAGRPYGFQMGSSVPFRLASGAVGVLHVFDFGGFVERNVTIAFREFNRVGAFSATSPIANSTIDGYDLLERNGAFASYIGTCDYNGVQPFVHWSAGPGTCVADDAWLLWDQSDIASDGATRAAVASLRIAPTTCPGDFMDSAYTSWRMQDVTFSSAKTMRSLVSTHYGGASIAGAQAFERFYYTKPYGRTRWEAWRRGGTVGGNCNGATSEDGFVRVDCRDWSFGVADPDDGQQPLSWPVDTRLGRGNLLTNGDFGAGTAFLGPWNRIDDVHTNRSIVQEGEVFGDLHSGNHVLALNWVGIGGNSIYQDVPRGPIPAGAPISFGARMWSSQAAAPVTLRVYQLRGNGSVVSFHDVSVALGGARNRYSGWFSAHPEASVFRFEMYLGQAAVAYYLDDAHLTQM
jgi:hypothetical protein